MDLIYLIYSNLCTTNLNNPSIPGNNSAFWIRRGHENFFYECRVYESADDILVYVSKIDRKLNLRHKGLKKI